MGVMQLIDSLNFYIETRDLPSAVFSVTATSTSTQTGSDQTNTSPGALFHVSFVTVAATATVRVMIQAKDPVSGLYAVMASVSIDELSVTTTGNLNRLLYVYPGAGTPGGTATAVGVPLSRIFRVQASITVINATATSAVALNVGMTPLK